LAISTWAPPPSSSPASSRWVRAADLARLAADPGTSAGTLATDIVAAWYSGLYEARGGLATISLASALLWDALDFTKPPGFCGGATGYWADAPLA
jgi:hypothetical protein